MTEESSGNNPYPVIRCNCGSNNSLHFSACAISQPIGEIEKFTHEEMWEELRSKLRTECCATMDNQVLQYVLSLMDELEAM